MNSSSGCLFPGPTLLWSPTTDPPILIPAPLTSCVTLDKSLHFSEPQSPPLLNGDKNAYIMDLSSVFTHSCSPQTFLGSLLHAYPGLERGQEVGRGGKALLSRSFHSGGLSGDCREQLAGKAFARGQELRQCRVGGGVGG